jgi:lysophospholipid acyltransferase (LPLAT)-like uncharacterized protein
MASWDRTQIPQPFSTVALVVGEPLNVNAEAGDDELERVRIDLEARLGDLERRALTLAGHSTNDPNA